MLSRSETLSERMAPEDVSRHELYLEDTEPTPEQILHTWGPVVLNAVSVLLQSGVQALVIVPLGRCIY